MVFRKTILIVGFIGAWQRNIHRCSIRASFHQRISKRKIAADWPPECIPRRLVDIHAVIEQLEGNPLTGYDLQIIIQRRCIRRFCPFCRRCFIQNHLKWLCCLRFGLLRHSFLRLRFNWQHHHRCGFRSRFRSTGGFLRNRLLRSRFIDRTQCRFCISRIRRFHCNFQRIRWADHQNTKQYG